MKNSPTNQKRNWALMFCLLLPLHLGAEQFLELTAEIEVNNWDYWFFEDKIDLSTGTENAESIFPKSYMVRCIVGTNLWMLEGTNFVRDAKTTWWFTGTNVVEHSVNTKVGGQFTRVHESSDGNPGRPVRVADLLTLRGRICWLALCSGSVLKRDGRKIYPPNDFWKESWATVFSDATTLFDDSLGLPRRLELFAKNDQPFLQYQVRQSTNVLGWSIPLEFYLIQYKPVNSPANDRGWELHLTAKGKVTFIKEATKPEIPTEALKSVLE